MIPVRIYRVKGTRLHVVFDHEFGLVATAMSPASRYATVVDRLDIEPEGRSHLSDGGRVLIVDAFVLSEIIAIIHKPNDTPKAIRDRLLQFFPGSMWLPHMQRATIIAYLPHLEPEAGDDRYFAACARRQIAAHYLQSVASQ